MKLRGLYVFLVLRLPTYLLDVTSKSFDRRGVLGLQAGLLSLLSS